MPKEASDAIISMVWNAVFVVIVFGGVVTALKIFGKRLEKKIKKARRLKDSE